MNKKKRVISVTAVILAIAAVITYINFPKKDKTVSAVQSVDELYEKIVYKKSESNYDAYLKDNSTLEAIKEKITFSAGKAYTAGDTFTAVFEAEKGLYEIELNYRADKSGSSAPEITVLLDGEIPYNEAFGISLPLYYESGEPETDERGNQYTPELSLSTAEITARLYDATGYHRQALAFAARDGKNTLSIRFNEGGAELISVAIIPKDSTEDVKSNESAEGEVSAFKVQAEYPLYRSDTSVAEVCDRTSSATEPAFDGIQVWNALGGNGWSRIGQRVVWQFEVKKSGNYSFAVRYRQNYLSGRASHRTLLIDGKVPDQTLADLRFDYDKDWQILNLREGDGTPVTVYLEEGIHTISLDVTLGEDSEIVNLAQQALYELNAIYRKLIMQTGANPDKYRDYQIEKKMPDVLEVMKSETEVLEGIFSLLYGQSSGEDSASITKLIWQLKEFLKEPESIPASMSVFQSNITAFGSWLQEKTSQPLCIDYFEFLPANQSPSKANNGFLSRLSFSAKQFLSSFAEDYGVIGSVYSSDEAMTVWLTQGRDQYQILKGQIDNGFTAKTGIPVNLKLVAGGLLESISAGIAPDVYLFGSETDPVNFASRGALVNLSDFDDYETVSKRFSEGALVPFRYSGGSYALPVTQTFLMMYVREDVFEELGFEIPKTWEWVYRILPFLQQNNMEFGFPVPSNANVYSFALILFQNQRELYRDGGKTVMLDTDEALDAFESWTKLYTDYSCIVDYNFVNRFRIGDIPIGIADFTVYNTLQVSAPEINGMWNMYPVPSGDNTDGYGYSVSAVSSAFILNQSERPDEAWEFLKWFTDGEEQYDYAMAIENLQGASARFSTANVAAFNQLSFKKSTLQQINVQRDKAVGVQQVPGGYFLSRHIDNIYRAVKNDGDDVRQTVLEYTDVINAELTRKRKEFGLETAE